MLIERNPTEQEQKDIDETRYIAGLVTLVVSIPKRPDGLPTMEEAQTMLDRLLYRP